MSQVTKRNAEDAFVLENAEETQAKKRRVRSKSNLAQPKHVNALEKTLRKEIPQPLDTPVSVHDISPVSKRSSDLKGTTANLTMGRHVVVPQTTSQEENSEATTPKQERQIIHEPIEGPREKDLVIQSKKKRSKRSGASKSVEQKPYNPSTWRMSAASGGTFLNHDPVLTLDNKIVILATSSSVQIYSSSTSLLIRSIQPSGSSPIVSYALSATHKSKVLIGLASGLIMAYELETGRKLDEWQTQPSLTYFVSIPSKGETESILATHSGGQEDSLRFSTLADKGKLRSTKLLQRPMLRSAVFASADGSAIVLPGKDRIHVGRIRDQPIKTDSEREYTWYELPLAGRIASWDARFVQSKSKNVGSLPTLSVAVGLHNGAILVFQDLFQKLMKTKDSVNVDNRGRRLHWHRKPARSVKWSRDGNYLVSGGDESVIVIWQLETNQRQYLPHLSTSILNITVSASGAYYAVRLADNSVMVLSTADLTPSTNITGLSLRQNEGLSSPVVLHPSRSNQLLAAVPLRSVGSKPGTATHLQTFDVDTNLQLHKQALTRNLTTAVNVGPNGTPLREPEIIVMNVSCDGKWLATVDEWSQSPLDLQGMYLEEDEDSSNASHEIVMRFWNWNVSDNSWDLITRIDQPHTPSILAMSPNPVLLEFATIGGDGSLKIWTPKARVRDGIAVRNAGGEPLYTWTCSRQYQVEKNLLATVHSKPPPGAISYSEDGTVLAVSWSSPVLPHRHVHLIDSRTGTISLSQPRLLTAGPASLSFLGRYLIAMSDQVVIFDTVALQNISVISLNSKFVSVTGNNASSNNKFLAVSHQTNTFAIGVNPADTKAHRSGLLSVFDVETADQGPKAEFDVATGISALLADPAGRGFWVIDREARIRKIISPGSVNAAASMSLIAQPETGMQMVQTGKGVEEIFGSRNQDDEQADVLQQRFLEDADAVEIRSRNLNDLFRASSTAALPAVNELFERVAKAVAGIRVGV